MKIKFINNLPNIIKIKIDHLDLMYAQVKEVEGEINIKHLIMVKVREKLQMKIRTHAISMPFVDWKNIQGQIFKCRELKMII